MVTTHVLTRFLKLIQEIVLPCANYIHLMKFIVFSLSGCFVMCINCRDDIRYLTLLLYWNKSCVIIITDTFY